MIARIALVMLTCLGLAEAATTQRFVLSAGANDGGADRVRLRYAVSDASNFADVMAQMGGVAPSDRILLSEPDRDGFIEALHRLGDRLDRVPETTRSEVLLYYSGHADETGLLLGGDRLDYRHLRSLLDEIGADVRIAILDACASGAITRIKGGQRRAAFLLDSSSDTRGYAFLTSSSAEESAQESDRIGGSFFTHYLVSGMRGAADVSDDGQVTLSEAYQFAFRETLARTVDLHGGAQHPAYDMNLSGTGDVVMTDIRQFTAGLELSEDVDGRLYIRNGDRQLVAELNKAAGRRVELGLEPQNYEIYLRQGDGLQRADRRIQTGERVLLAAADFRDTPMEDAVLRGGIPGAPVPRLPESAGLPLRLELHFGRIGPEPHARIPGEDPGRAGDQLTEGSDAAVPALPAPIRQIQPWETLGGFTIAYRLRPDMEATLAYSTLASDMHSEAVTADGQARLRQVRLTSWQFGGRWLLRREGWLPFFSGAIATFSGQEKGRELLSDESWHHNEGALGVRLGAGLDVPVTRFLSFGVRAGYNWMRAFRERIGGRRDYDGGDLRLAINWHLGH
ncbi:MAG: caspase family protein [Gemmatimonadetes bacterium]|jgi:hypothetical protein|nr:caspase family protein [Gemmatimonadota bacterium]MBT7862620.1 caspase family protein [Gemmatimonadota bacterium]